MTSPYHAHFIEHRPRTSSTSTAASTVIESEHLEALQSEVGVLRKENQLLQAENKRIKIAIKQCWLTVSKLQM